MAFEERQQIIRELQRIRQTKIVTHIHSDRRVPPGTVALPGIITRLGTEAQPFFYKALRGLGKHPKLDLYLYTGGGQTDSVWPLVSLFREFGKEFNVLVPYKSHSAGTLICLGANTVIMGEAGELSPVDPQTGNQFNPIDEIEPKTRRAISVEEVTSYFDLAKDPSRRTEGRDEKENGVDQDLAFRLLAEQVHPLALGNVNRSHKQIRGLAKRLLELHYEDGPEQEKKIQAIVNALTQGRYSHSDILNRHEASELLGKQMVKSANEQEQDLMWRLFENYSDTLHLLKPFMLLSEVGDQQQMEMEVIGAFLETEEESFIFRSICKIFQRSEFPPQFHVNLQPGQLVPLVPGLPRQFNIELLDIGWTVNERRF